jgi:hypothetical protein
MAVGIKSRDQLDREWWDAWWKADYSWDGLARKKWAGWFIHADGTVRDEGGNAWPPTIATPSVSPASAGDPPPPPEAVEASIAPGALFPPHPEPVEGRGGESEPRPATLQDYWRRDPETGQVRTDEEMEATGELTRDPHGKLWHIVHMPTEWRLAPQSPPPPAGEVVPKGPVGASTSSLSPLALRQAQGEGGTGASAQTWKSDLDHPDWARVEAVLAPRLVAGTTTEFDVISRLKGPDGRTQAAGAVLRRACTHPEGPARPLHLQALWVRFLGEADFRQQVFGPRAWFENAAFSGSAWFDNAAFSGDAGFYDAVFSGDAWFHNAAFSRYAGFQNAVFCGEAVFLIAAFSGDAGFEKAAFSGNAWFDNAAFSGNAWFEKAAFSGIARFENAAFSGAAEFEKAVFKSKAWFTGAATPDQLPGGEQGLSLTLAPEDADRARTLEGKILTPASDGPMHRRSFRTADFSGAVFHADVDFSNRTFLAATNFSGATFSGLALFHDAKLHQDTNFTHADFLMAKPPKQIGAGEDAQDPTPAEALQLRDAHYAAYERAFRTLKLAMESHRARREEALFYRKELEARRQRPARRFLGRARGPDGKGAALAPSAYWSRPPGGAREAEAGRKEVTAIEKGFSYLYGLTSGYGDSLLAPIGALAGLWVSFALIYGSLAGVFLETPAPACLAGVEGTTAVCPTLQTLLVFSGRHTFLPVVMTDQDQAKWWFDATRAAPLIPFLVEFVHRLASAVLIFLLALAVRRRFQIN